MLIFKNINSYNNIILQLAIPFEDKIAWFLASYKYHGRNNLFEFSLGKYDNNVQKQKYNIQVILIVSYKESEIIYLHWNINNLK